jgi:endoglucanase
MRSYINTFLRSLFPAGLLLIMPFYCSTQPTTGKIQLDQLGFYPHATKLAVITGESSDNFFVINGQTKDTVYGSSLSKQMQSRNSSVKTKIADFSEVQQPGSYVLAIPGLENSYPFSIANSVHHPVAIASLKGFYYQRVSMPLEKEYADIWARPAGHPDTAVLIHPSAATAKRPAGTIISSSGGWYDAGDYNKYVVNSGITMGTLLSAWEDLPVYFDTLNTHIPESNDNVPDILQEALYNLRWMLTMQDPDDGGVYNKCTNANFDGMVMPGVTTLPRYVVQKGTAATLDFAAVTAQAARIFSRFKKQLPGLSDSCLKASVNAWQWALQNPALVYDQQAMNKLYEPVVSTGGYGDRNFTDEWYWAAAELFVTTKDKKYYSILEEHGKTFFSLPSWGGVGMLGYYTLIRSERSLPKFSSKNIQGIKEYIVRFADSLLSNIENNAFRTVIGGSPRDFVWGSNAVAANQGIALINAWYITKNAKYVAEH